jgi:protein-tyrosine-phosphatase
MAHGFLADRSARLFGGAIHVRSAGTWARPGSPPTFDAVRSATDRDVDIGDLRSTPFSPQLAAWADLVVAMTAEQRAEILEQAAEAAEKTFTLKEVVALLEALPEPAGERSRAAILGRIAAANDLRASAGSPSVADDDVADPLGQPPFVFRAVASEIEDLTDRLVEGLLGAAEHAPAREA